MLIKETSFTKKKKTWKRRIPIETPKEKNFNMKRDPIHVNSHLKVILTRSILTKQADLTSILQNPEQGSQSLTIFDYIY